MLKIAGFILAAILAAFLFYVLALTVIYIVKSLIKEIKGGGQNDRKDKQP